MKRSLWFIGWRWWPVSGSDGRLPRTTIRLCPLCALCGADYSGKPVKNAAVVLHRLNKGKQSRGGIELKTNTEGRTGFEESLRPLRLQVLMRLQTFGRLRHQQARDGDYDPAEASTDQYSIYENHPEEKKKRRRTSRRLRNRKRSRSAVGSQRSD